MGAPTHEWTCTDWREAKISLALEKPQGWKASLALHPVDNSRRDKIVALGRRMDESNKQKRSRKPGVNSANAGSGGRR